MLGPTWLISTIAAAAPVDAWLDAVVLVQQGTTTCAGVLVDAKGTVATAYHCVAPGGRPRVVTRSGSAAVGRVTGVDVGSDLAVLAVAGLAGSSFLAVADAPPAAGDPVFALGHPLGADPASGFYDGTLRWSAASGRVSAVGSSALQLDAPVNPGNSGGPVVDTDGHVVGIVSRKLGGQGLSYAGRAGALTALLAADDRRLGAFGGTLAAELILGSLDRPTGSLSIGARGEVAIRDRFVLTGIGMAPLSHRWSAARFGRSDAVRAAGTAGLRQRFGRGSWAPRLDGWGGVAWIDSLTAAPDDPLSLSSEGDLSAVVGGTLRVRSVGLELGAVLGETPGAWTVVSLRFPGVVAVF